MASRTRMAWRLGALSLLLFGCALVLAIALGSMLLGVVAGVAGLSVMSCYVVFETTACPSCGKQFFVTGEISDPRFTRTAHFSARGCVHCGAPIEIQILPFSPDLESRVIEFIVGIQREEFGIDIDAERQPDLRTIPDFYQVGAGNFWVALAEDEVVGTISLLDIGRGQAALRKMFVRRALRGPGSDTAVRLLDTLLVWAESRCIREVFLGTTPQFRAAHRFYEKHGFVEIPRSALPPSFPIMEVDTKFYRLGLSDRTAP